MSQQQVLDKTAAHASFATSEGASEHYLLVTSNRHSNPMQALADIEEEYCMTLKQLGLHESTMVFCRFYVSNIADQEALLRRSTLFGKLHSGAISIIQQEPLGTGPVAALFYHVNNPGTKFTRYVYNNGNSEIQNTVCIRGSHYGMTWTINQTATNPLTANSEVQTAQLFQDLAAIMNRHELSVNRNLVRTWIYLHDIDNNYTGMVKARREFYTKSIPSRYTASTGIAGKSPDTKAIVSMDSLAFSHIREKQISVMNAPSELPHPTRYGVTFERGLRLRFGDRSHLYISGTASIDRHGTIMHKGNAGKQAARTIDIIKALLHEQGASINNMLYLVCYLRDPGDFAAVTSALREHVPHKIPCLVVKGAVCRPGWLFEMEGVGIMPDKTMFAPFL